MTARRIVFLVFALVVTAVAAAQAPQPSSRSGPEDWTRCEVVERDGTVRELRCPDFHLRLMRAPTLDDRAGLSAAAQALGLTGTSREETLRVGDTSVPMLVTDRVTLVAPMRHVIAGCTDPDSERRARCVDSVRSIVRTRRLPPGVAFPPTRREFLGTELSLPAGCSMAGAERMVCSSTGTALDWREQPLVAGRTAESTIDGYVAIVAARVHVDSDVAVSCSMRGTTSRGRRVRATVAGNALDIVVCAAERDGQVSIAGCIGNVPPGAPYPAPCAQVFDAPAP